jgi:curved DNA-binding protein
MDHYQLLGVSRTATPDEIKKAYRKLAAQYHPDREGGDTAKFQEIQQAYAILGDPEKKAQYDNPQSHFSGFGQSNFNFDSIFDIFGARFNHQGQQGTGQQQGYNPFAQHQQRRPQIRFVMWVSLTEVAIGGKKTVNIGTQHGNTTIQIEIPKGIEDNDSVQYPDLAPNGGDLIVTFRVHPNQQFQRNGLHVTTPKLIDFWDCILGCEIMLSDVTETRITMQVPPMTQPGAILRLKGKGIQDRHGNTGDLYVKIQAKIPDQINPEILAAIQNSRNT